MRPLGKVIIFRDKHTERQTLIYTDHKRMITEGKTDGKSTSQVHYLDQLNILYWKYMSMCISSESPNHTKRYHQTEKIALLRLKLNEKMLRQIVMFI